MRVLDGLADLYEEVQPLDGGEIVGVAVVGDADAPHQFHHEIGPAMWDFGFRISDFGFAEASGPAVENRSEEHTSEPSHRTISYAVFCLKKKKKKKDTKETNNNNHMSKIHQ